MTYLKTLVLAFVVTLLCARLATAQIDLSGEWSPQIHEDLGHRVDDPAIAGGIAGAGGPRVGDYTGLPINTAARLKADSWDARIVSSREHQTIVNVAGNWVNAPGGMRISKVIDDLTDQLLAYKLYRSTPAGTQTRMVWMDGRSHPPPYAAHTGQGFSTGTWQGDVLTVETTHVKVGWIRRNGVPTSDLATITEHFARHGNYLTVIRFVDDPIYLEEPLVTSATWIIDLRQQLAAPLHNEIVDEVPGRPDAFVPHHLPGTNEFLQETADRMGLPLEATRGGKETTYPEYQLVLQKLMTKRSK